MDNQKWVVLGKDNCDFCKKATNLLNERGIPWVYYNIDLHSQLKSFVLDCGFATVPQVFLNGHLIGGFHELNEYIRQDNLMKEQMEFDFQNNPFD